jgi:Kef-type K+ transport system membrane component KefB
MRLHPTLQAFLVAAVLAVVTFGLVLFAQASFSTQAQLAVDVAFLERVELAIVSAAIDVSNEATSTPNHSWRAALAQRVVAAPNTYAQQMAWGIVADTSITSSSTDTVLKNRVAAIWNTYAGN